MNERNTLQVFDARPGVLYPLETVVHLTGVSRRSILLYCKSGLLTPGSQSDDEPMSFDENAVYRIRQIEALRTVHGMNLGAIQMIFELLQEIERLQEEIRFLRSGRS